MTKEAALQAFWSGFGLVAYQENAVPTGENKPAYPYLTYEVVTDSWGGAQPMAVSLWYRSTSWVDINAKAAEIGRAVSRGGVYLRCDGGAIILQRGEPFARSMGDENDPQVKRKILTVMVEYLTED